MADIQDLQRQISQEWDQDDSKDRGKIIQAVHDSVDPDRWKDELATHMYISPQLVLDARLNDFKAAKVAGGAPAAKQRIQDLFQMSFLGLLHNDIPISWTHLRPIDATNLSRVLSEVDDSQGLRHLKAIVAQAWDAQDYPNALHCCYARYGRTLTTALHEHGYHGKGFTVHHLQQQGDKDGLLHEVEQDVPSLWSISASGIHGMSKQDLFRLLEDIDKTTS